MNRKSFRVMRAGERTNVDGKPVSNKVLLAMPDNEYELIRPDLRYVDLPHRLSLHEATQAIEFVYFPNRGMVSQVVVTKDGRTVEVGVVGNEGYVGAGLAVGLSRSSIREIVQIAGDGFRIAGNALERILRIQNRSAQIARNHVAEVPHLFPGRVGAQLCLLCAGVEQESIEYRNVDVCASGAVPRGLNLIRAHRSAPS